MDEHGPLADEQTWGAFEGDRAVAQLLAHEWKISGGITCDVAAVSGVGTLPEFRRLGLLRTMMGLLFKDMMERGQPVAALQATQAAIYQRYGYSEAVRNVRSYSIDTVDVAFLDGNGKAHGRPVGLAVDRTGALLIADDLGNTGWRVSGASAEPSTATPAAAPATTAR